MPREQLEDMMLAGLLLTVPRAGVREVTVFGADGLRSGASGSLPDPFPRPPIMPATSKRCAASKWNCNPKTI